jgi:hypothetical protein
MSEWVGECAVLSVLTTSPPFGIELHDLCMLMLLHSVLVVTLLLQCDLDVAARPLTGEGGDASALMSLTCTSLVTLPYSWRHTLTFKLCAHAACL